MNMNSLSRDGVWLRRRWLLLPLAISAILVAPIRGASMILVVTTTNDSGSGSLRQAILDANTNNNPREIDEIHFDIPGPGPYYVIKLKNDPIESNRLLPTIYQPLKIDGATQPGYFPGKPVIVLDGSDAGPAISAINIEGPGASGCTVQALVINNVKGRGIQLYSNNGSAIGNFIGTDPTGAFVQSNATHGIVVSANNNNNMILNNVISGNQRGILIAGCEGTVVKNNFIGTSQDGSVDAGNFEDGIEILNAINTTVQGNVISGNNRDGITFGGNKTWGNIVQGNFIGTDKTGTLSLGNSGAGVNIQNSPNNTIGGPTPGMRNVISGNGSEGVRIYGGLAVSNNVQGNFIGINATGAASLPNTGNGVLIEDASSNTVAGIMPNVISGNTLNGVTILQKLDVAKGNLVQGNLIGAGPTGDTAVPNGNHGVSILNASYNTVQTNLLAGNGGAGIVIFGSKATGNVVHANLVGTSGTGLPIPNLGQGLLILNGNKNWTLQNTIAFNGGAGVLIVNGVGNLIRSNSIFSNTGLGIQLAVGGNNLQNPPFLQSAVRAGNQTTVRIIFKHKPSTKYTIDFFVNDEPDPSGYGEGQSFLETIDLMTSPDPHPLLTNVILPDVPAGKFITATATDPNENTSAFSNAKLVVTKKKKKVPIKP